MDPSGLFDITTRLSINTPGPNDDVKALQNQLAWLGYLSTNDRDGYFGPKTLDAVNQYKSDSGLQNDTEDTYGIVGLTTWQSLGLIYLSGSDLLRGVTIYTDGDGGQWFDVSEPLNTQLANVTYKSRGHWLDAAWFISQVNTGAPWDIKRPEMWKHTLGITYPGDYNSPVIFNGEFFTPEQLGNITYGYLGAAIGYSMNILKAGSEFAALPMSTQEDVWAEYQDHQYIKRGYDWYHKGW